MEFVFDILLGFVMSLVGAFVGVIWPPKSPEWAIWQKWGMLLGAVAVLSLATAISFAWFTDGSAVVLPMSLLGGVALLGFAIIGNICRQYHEGS
jgi:hypothetical protein